ncbi:MAG: hypothetical protein ACP5OA_00575 [Candidatus Woesearchaeota archaeon]
MVTYEQELKKTEEELALTKRELMKVKKALTDQVKVNNDIGPFVIELYKIINSIIETLPEEQKKYVKSKMGADDFVTALRAVMNMGRDLKVEADDVRNLN